MLKKLENDQELKEEPERMWLGSSAKRKSSLLFHSSGDLTEFFSCVSFKNQLSLVKKKYTAVRREGSGLGNWPEPRVLLPPTPWVVTGKVRTK